VGTPALVLCLAAALGALGSAPQESPAPERTATLAELALRADEREECLALALSEAMAGDCAAGLTRIQAARGAGPAEDELGLRLTLEEERLRAWIELRDEFLAELAAAQKPLTVDVGGKKVASPFTREGDELVLAKGSVQRLPVKALRPEELVAQIPKERFAGEREWLKVYPYCVTANPKWKRLTTEGALAADLKRDAEALYPRLAALRPAVQRLDGLARSPWPADAAGARAALGELDLLLALRAEACVAARIDVLAALVRRLLEQAAGALGAAELTHAAVTEPAPGTLHLAYDFAAPAQAGDWLPDDDYLSELRSSLDPVAGTDEAARFAPGPKGFAGSGAVVWRHALEFTAPLRVRYQVRWDPIEGTPGKVFAFALGMLADADGRHARANELGFLYVDELDGPYAAVRPKGDATVQLGQTYALELVHDGQKVAVRVDGTPRAEAPAGGLEAGRVFLWVHSDLRIAVPRIEIEGGIDPASLEAARAGWVQRELAARGFADAR
jgi:hypothetical protein